ncbi:hypothetical protein [Streptomyces scopuliridis]|uniref:hypothetical protein n=1 Tax=Streptomyces scopuliridis TaxID=452529 RepID=UPI00367EBA12
MAAAVGKAVPGLLGPDGADASGVTHPDCPGRAVRSSPPMPGPCAHRTRRRPQRTRGTAPSVSWPPQKDRPARRRAGSAPLTR